MSLEQKFDVVIVGAGPAGIFTALTIVREQKNSSPFRIAIFDTGKKLENRRCYIHEGRCRRCRPCSMLCGWGGSGAYSDGKLTLSTVVGGWLGDILSVKELETLLEEVKKIFLEFGASAERLFNPEGQKIDRLRRRAFLSGMELNPFSLLHVGTDRTRDVMLAMFEYLKEKDIEVYFETPIEDFIVEENKVIGIKTRDGRVIKTRYCVVGVGREGADWLRDVAEQQGLKVKANPVDVGVRVEIPAEMSKEITDALYEFKCTFYSPTFDQLTRTFCVCPNGEVSSERISDDILTVNGHSYASLDRQTDCTNFAILVSTNFTEPFHEPIAYGTYVAGLASLLSDNEVIIQRLTDLKRGRRSTPERIRRSMIQPTMTNAVPGDLSFVLPYRHLTSILEMLDALESLIPGINGNHTFLYGVEAKFYSSRLELSKEMETEISGLYAVGDGAGITRSLAQASVSGILAGRSILSRLPQE